jgi:hypothetical protein
MSLQSPAKGDDTPDPSIFGGEGNSVECTDYILALCCCDEHIVQTVTVAGVIDIELAFRMAFPYLDVLHAQSEDFPQILCFNPELGTTNIFNDVSQLLNGAILSITSEKLQRRFESRHLKPSTGLQKGIRTSYCMYFTVLAIVVALTLISVAIGGLEQAAVRYQIDYTNSTTSALNSRMNVYVSSELNALDSLTFLSLDVSDELLVSDSVNTKASSSTYDFRIGRNGASTWSGITYISGDVRSDSGNPIKFQVTNATSQTSSSVLFKVDNPTANHNVYFPDCNGTLLTTDLTGYIKVLPNLQYLNVTDLALFRGDVNITMDKGRPFVVEGSETTIRAPLITLGQAGTASLEINEHTTMTFVPQSGSNLKHNYNNYLELNAQVLQLGDFSAAASTQRVELRGTVKALNFVQSASDAGSISLRAPPLGGQSSHTIQWPAYVAGPATVITSGNLNDITSVGDQTNFTTTDFQLLANGADSGTVASWALFHADVTASNTLTAQATSLFQDAVTVAAGVSTKFLGPVTFTHHVIIGDSAGDNMTVLATTAFQGDTLIGDAGTDVLRVAAEIVGALRFTGTAATGNVVSLAPVASPTPGVIIELPDATGTAVSDAHLSLITSTGTLTGLTVSGLFNAQGAVTLGSSAANTVTFQSATTAFSGALTFGDAVTDALSVTSTLIVNSATITLGDAITDALSVKASILGGLIFTNAGANSAIAVPVAPTATATLTLPDNVNGDLVTETWFTNWLLNTFSVTDLKVTGKVTAGKLDLTGNGATPVGMISYFNLANCPSGWTLVGAAEGRFIVGMAAGGSQGHQQGTAWTNTPGQPTHSHTFNAVGGKTSSDGAHTHAMPYAGTYDSGYNWGGGCTASYPNPSGHSHSATSAGAHQHDVVFSGQTTTTSTANRPYIQLLPCQKLAN